MDFNPKLYGISNGENLRFYAKYILHYNLLIFKNLLHWWYLY